MQIELVAPGAHINLRGRIPITLGSFPLMDINTQNANKPYIVSIQPTARTRDEPIASSSRELWNSYLSSGKSY